MNVSPTPKRYGRSSNQPQTSLYDDHLYQDKIVPEEYKINSSMINSLIKQNKDLMNKLECKQQEIDRLNLLVGSLRSKLIKYTELNKKLSENENKPTETNTITESEDYIQIPKKNSKNLETDRLNDIYDKLEQLTKMVSFSPNLSHISSKPSSTLQNVTDEDIMVSESSELKNLEQKIDNLKRKLLIKKENELRKLSLNQELLDLMEKLDTKGDNVRIPSPNRSTTPHNVTLHCDQCHKPSNNFPHTKFMNIKDALETPTPLKHRKESIRQPTGLW